MAMVAQILQLVRAALRESVPAQLKGPATTGWGAKPWGFLQSLLGHSISKNSKAFSLLVESPATVPFVYLVQRS